MPKLDNDGLIKQWQAAYRMANGKAAPGLVYDRGWFRFMPSTGFQYRRCNIEQMRDRLLATAGNELLQGTVAQDLSVMS
jgi:hypothetical protein